MAKTPGHPTWRSASILLLCLAALGVPGVLLAHARLISPVPRQVLTSKSPPCGGVPRGLSPLVLEAGSELEVGWEEYIDHPGYHRLLFSAGGDRSFVPLLDRIADKPIPTGQSFVRYKATVRLPSTPCDACTLQLIQVMTENPSAPSLYYSCADIRLVAPAPAFRRGDANGDGEREIGDALGVLFRLFVDGRDLPCLEAADVDDDGAVLVHDVLLLLHGLFLDQLALPGACGPDPTADALGCAAPPGCSVP